MVWIVNLFLLVAVTAYAEPISGLNLGEFTGEKTGQLKWENNPFVQSVDAVGIQDLHLTAIVYRTDNAAALINGHILRKGQKMGNIQVVHIEPNRVVLRNQDGLFSLTLGGVGK